MKAATTLAGTVPILGTVPRVAHELEAVPAEVDKARGGFDL